MKAILIYAIIVSVLGCSEFGHAKDVLDLTIDIKSGVLPMLNDKHYNFYVKDFFGLIDEYTRKMTELKVHLDQDYKRWAEQLKSDKNSFELLKSAYAEVTNDLSTYLNDVVTSYGQVTPVAIVKIIDAVNHMRKYEREFYSKVHVNSQNCHDLVDRYLFYKWEKPAIHCAHAAIIASITIQLQYTYNINAFYARFVDQFNLYAGVADGEKQNYVAAYLTRAKAELLEYSKVDVGSVQKLGQDTAVCATKSYQEFEQLMNSITKEAAACF